MIQRLQSLYLALILLLCIVQYSGSILGFADVSGDAVKLLANGNLTDETGQVIGHVENIWFLTIILILVALLALITIFLFKTRKSQLRLTAGLIILSAVLLIALCWFGYNVISAFRMSISPGLKMAVPLLILVFSALAYRGILKDERLVKSYDRLR